MYFTTKEISSYGYFYKFFKDGSGSAFLKQLDSDSQKMNADPQPCFYV